MGTPEFPDLGKHCSVEDCNLIDFLPFTCDRCNKVFCLQHRSYTNHKCPNPDEKDINVLICPLCAKGVRLVPNEDPNITWEIHVNGDCDPSNYQKATKKKKCPANGCKELLTFSNTIRCRDCAQDHCLKHRFGADHKCPGPKRSDNGFKFAGILRRSAEEGRGGASSSGWWGSGILSGVRESAGVGIQRLSGATAAVVQRAREGLGQGGGGELQERCVQCSARFSSVSELVEHVEKSHKQQRSGGGGAVARSWVTVDVCPKCGNAFRDPVALVNHVERDHGGTS